uniref:Butyrate kinase n=1 Tax=uncultured bacterium BAC10-10 TaxID=333372 RepID=Q4JIP9_9BACT|nr:conserved hypothetical protein [uncultured bacterium BAC10-10]
MPRVIGIDPGTVSIDLCGIDDGRVFLDRSFPTAEALARPSILIDLLTDAHAERSIDLVAGPSGYGLPLVNARDLTDEDLRLAQLTAGGEASGGIGGLGGLMRQLAGAPVPVVFTPGVVHLSSVPAHRKINRIDMGTADKVCAVALGIHERSRQLGCRERDVSFILLELGGAFTAAIAVEQGQIVDGAGGSSGPMGLRGAGSLDGEVAFLCGSVPKGLLFGGGVATVAGTPDADADQLAHPGTSQGRLAWAAYLESATKAVAALMVSAPGARDVILSGRVARIPAARDELTRRLAKMATGTSVYALAGFAAVAKTAAQGAALVADGLAGGMTAALVDTLGIRQASGTVLDHLHVISPAAARARLGIPW